MTEQDRARANCIDDIDCDCGRGDRQRQYDAYGIYCGFMCDRCFGEKYKQYRYFDAGFAGECLEPEDY